MLAFFETIADGISCVLFVLVGMGFVLLASAAVFDLISEIKRIRKERDDDRSN